MLAPGSPIHVEKLKPNGALDFAWDGVVVRWDTSRVVLRAEFNVDLVERDFATFRRGDVFHEFYYFDRSYNVFQISAPDGTLKGWYGNLGLPAELNPKTGHLQYIDLALDIWANPDGTYVVLDEDELADILLQYPELSGPAAQGRADLIELAESRRLPRWPE
jgi:protein associated with RNAse G/E